MIGVDDPFLSKDHLQQKAEGGLFQTLPSLYLRNYFKREDTAEMNPYRTAQPYQICFPAVVLSPLIPPLLTLGSDDKRSSHWFPEDFEAPSVGD